MNSLVDSTNITNITDMEEFLHWSPEVRPLMLLLGFTVILTGTVGNLLVVYASFIRKVMKMERVSLLFLRWLAITDFLMSWTIYVPVFITIASKRWLLGEFACFYVGNMSYALGEVEVLIVMGMSIYRAWMITKSRSERGWIKDYHIYGALGLLALLAFLLPVIMNILPGPSYAFYDPYSGNCLPIVQFRKEGILLAGLYLTPPLILTFVCNSVMMCVMKYQGRNLKGNTAAYQKTYITLTLIYWSMMFSYIPLFIQSIAGYAGAQSRILPDWFYLFRIYMMSLNVVINPFIYMGTMNGFRRFVVNILSCKSSVTTDIYETRTTSAVDS
ncbi:melanopsin-like [Bolinopsis microptera]|uniref:melanopsin-like n=1 Tax=Bolinopsis microptera TaxID=2820187 RepID=UPI00307A358A